MGQRLREGFSGWRAAVFTGNPELGKEMGLRAVKSNNLYNGSIRCRLFHFDINGEHFTKGPPDGQTEEAIARKAAEDGKMFANRLRKNLKAAGEWTAFQGITCFRLYDADIPEFNIAVDLYGEQVHVQEYEAPRGVDPRYAAARLETALELVREILDLTGEKVHLKVRRRQRAGSQYGKNEDKKQFFEVREGGLGFLVNLTDYLDTGLFLDHRTTRGMIRDLARDRDFLNLFCYTGAATVYAADGGAASTASVDMSGTYLDWARRNMDLNNFRGSEHRFHRADVLKWIRNQTRRYGLIFLDPPTYSRSKTMEGDFDIQRDHVLLIRDTARLLAPEGTLIFSTNRRKFTLDTSALEGLEIEDITDSTIPKDFQRSRWVHKCYKITTR
jgi:23S rRNA (guanine2445-N2)-methyltransferase / 23S rRNA (guanine2069-N7)-methyltransferase